MPQLQNLQIVTMIDKKTYIECAVEVTRAEISGVQSLINFFDESYIKTIDLILNCKGRVILSGMGKSGHIAHKIASTLSSTGTPSFFVHPGEASHGDLGMITANDVAILLSNSGETIELRDILYYCKRFGIPTISIVRKSESELAKLSDVALVIPALPEANQINAPTTSTTMMLVLGDAIAVTLLQVKGFNSEKFGIFHPGGKIGTSFIKVKDLMRFGELLPLIDEGAEVSDLLIEMTSKHLGCAIVINKNKALLGIVTDGDLRRHLNQKNKEFLHRTAGDLMTKDPLTVDQNSLAIEAIKIMNDRSITSLIVAEKGEPIGIIHIHDCLRIGVR